MELALLQPGPEDPAPQHGTSRAEETHSNWSSEDRKQLCVSHPFGVSKSLWSRDVKPGEG